MKEPPEKTRHVSHHPIVNLLVADDSLSDVEAFAQHLRGTGYVVNLTRVTRGAEIDGHLRSEKDLDLALVRIRRGLPAVDELRARIGEASRDVPIIALADPHGEARSADLLRAGAAAACDPRDPESLVVLVQRELAHLDERRQRRRFETLYREARERCRALLDSSREAIAYLHEGAHIYANPAYLDLFGYTGERDLLDGLTLMNLVPREERDRLKAWLRKASKGAKGAGAIELTGLRLDGGRKPIALEYTPVRVDDEACLQVLVRDLSQQSLVQEQIDELSNIDSLTGIYTRLYFTRRLREIRRSASPPPAALLYILLHEFRPITERLGIEAGDQLVADAAELLRGVAGEDDLLAHFADAAFTLYTETDGEGAMALANRICKEVAERDFQAANQLIATTCCIGVCAADDAVSATAMLARADQACEKARQMGGDQVELYTPRRSAGEDAGQSELDEEYLQLINDALAGEGLLLSYQPIADLHAQGAELYKVWVQVPCKRHAPLPVSTVAPTAKRHGMMVELDRWVVDHALREIAGRARADRRTTLFVRISRNSVIDPNLASWLGERIHTLGVPRHWIVLEVVEQTAEQCFKEVMSLRDELRGVGCDLALIQFGGKPNSERIMRKLLPEYIKVDARLLERLAKESTDDKDAQSRRAMMAITKQARSLEVQVIAGGVATAPQMASIWQFGINLVQGSVIQEPRAAMDFDFKQF